MIITKKEFEAIVEKVIETTNKEAEKKQKSLNLDVTRPEEVKEVKKISNKMLKLLYKGMALELFEDADEKEVAPEEFCLTTAKYVDCAVQIEKNPVERSLYELVCLTNSKKVFDEIFGEKGNEWLKKECEQE